MEILDTAKHYFWSLFSVIAVVFFWAGVWDGIGYLPYLENPLISLIVGIVILASSGLIFKEFNPMEETEKTVIINKIDKTTKEMSIP